MTDDAGVEPDADEGLPPLKRWSERRRGMDPEARRRVMDACAIRTRDGWLTNFVLMMVLSVVVAVMGLSAGSAALVIGAMLLAPLMTPVLGTAAALTMSLGRPLLRSIVALVLASVGAIVLAYLVAILLPDSLTGEVLARTRPDARDLIVALAAGAAGAYSLSRPDLSSTLPGVAIAVALVPPLGVVGITLEAGRTDLAKGAGLLYVTNLAAIVLAGVVVLVIGGFSPLRRLANTSNRVIAGAALTLVVVIVVSVPLTIASLEAAADARRREDVEAAVEAWLAGTDDEIDAIDIDDDHVAVRLSGVNEPPTTESLLRSLQAILGDEARLDVRWTQARLAQPNHDDPPPTDEELREASVRTTVDQWLAVDGEAFDVAAVVLGDAGVRVDIVSANPPPSVDDLAQRLAAELGTAPELEVNWTRRTELRPGTTTLDLDEVTAELRRIAADWAVERPDVEIVSVSYDGTTVTVDLVGAEDPPIGGLRGRLAAAVDPEPEIVIWFSARTLLAPTPTPTPTPRPTPTPTPSPTPTPGFILIIPTPTPTPG